MGLSLDWKAHVPDLLLSAGSRVCCQFQKSLANLVYVIHVNMDREKPSLGEVQLLLYTSEGESVSANLHPDPQAPLFLTDTHIVLL